MATKTFAILDVNNLVTNIIKWDGVTKWDVPVGSTSRDVTAVPDVGIGYTFDGVKYIAPPPPPEPPPSQVQITDDRVAVLEKSLAVLTARIDAAGIK